MQTRARSSVGKALSTSKSQHGASRSTSTNLVRFDKSRETLGTEVLSIFKQVCGGLSKEIKENMKKSIKVLKKGGGETDG